MCIVFIYVNSKDIDGDYSLILASNRDEYYDRPAITMAPWDEDPNVFGGRDIKAGGTWLAISPLRRKLGVILNVPGYEVNNAKSRGKLVMDFVMSDKGTNDYISSMDDYIKDCSGFVLATAEFGNANPTVKAYCNIENEILSYNDYVGLSNSLPLKPLTKAETGKEKFRDICSTYNKINKKELLIQELLSLLKSDEKHLPDPQLEERQPNLYKAFSSIFVNIPVGRYGTRTHTIVLVTKTGRVDAIEVNLTSPVDLQNPKWEVNKYEFDL